MKSIVLRDKRNINLENYQIKLREKVKNLKIDNSNNLLPNLKIQKNQVNYINNIFLGTDFPEKKLIINK